jgi:4-hydroxy-4-methyl-2-oxoglutarate aldolase
MNLKRCASRSITCGARQPCYPRPMRPDPRDLLPRLERLYTAVVSDCLDRLGVRDKAMRPDIRPLAPGMQVCGVAATALAHEVQSIPGEPYIRELEAVDRLRRDDVLLVSRVEGCFFGELLATASRARGARGVVLDCWTRDTRRLLDMGFPAFVRGISPLDSLGRIDVAALQVPIVCGGVLVHPGDLVLGDLDGVVVVPQAVAEEAVARAEEKVRGENPVRAVLAGGASVVETFRKYGVI